VISGSAPKPISVPAILLVYPERKWSARERKSVGRQSRAPQSRTIVGGHEERRGGVVAKLNVTRGKGACPTSASETMAACAHG
jgi:hypothetical protein